MSKRIACLGIFAAAAIAANPPGAAKAWDDCYDHPCHTRYYTGCYHCYPRYYPRYPRYYVYRRHYDEYPRHYVRCGSGFNAYDRSYYRYYSSYTSYSSRRYDDDYDW
jgi:hypothetical protein